MTASTARPSSVVNRVYIAVILITVALAAAIALILHLASAQYDKELRNWQLRLSLIADSRLDAVSGWVENQFNEMQGLAQNASLQLYVTELQTLGNMPAPTESADDTDILDETSTQEVYLRHLLTITAERSGFSPPPVLELVPANVERPGSGGIAILDKNAAPLVATMKMPPIEGAVAEFVRQAKPGESHLLDIAGKAGGALQIGFLTPIYAIQGNQLPSDQLGWVLGIRELNAEFFALLQQPGTIESSLEITLVRLEEGNIRYLSPLANGTISMQKTISMPANVSEQATLAAAFAVKEPGKFAIRTDYDLQPVLVTGRRIPNTPWTLVAKVNRDAVLADARAMHRSIITQLVLAVAAILVAIVAAWRHGASRNAIQLADRLRHTLQQAQNRETMLAAVANSQPEAIFITDENHRCWFANDMMAEQANTSRDAITGKPLEHVIGAALAEEYNKVSRQALEKHQSISWVRHEKAGQQEQARVYLCTHIPLRQLPTDTAKEGERGVLVVEEDITEVIRERERRMRTLRGLINTLVAMVDRRDPYAANHSAIVASTARAIAEEMRLEPEMVETAEIAGTLMNIGKMVVPSEWLTKAGALNEKERQAIRDSLLSSADMLVGVEFDGPVVETLRQSIEQWDGSGPQKLKGEEILVTARIIAVANTLIGMVSPRAYRKAIEIDQALQLLMDNMDKEFDRKVVIALVNYMDNHGGRELLAGLSQQKEAV